MLELSPGLDDRALAAIATLEREVLEADGGRLKLEWGTLRSRRPEEVNDLLWWDGDRLVGFLGSYSFGGGEPEVTGMVAPDARRSGVATRLLDVAVPLWQAKGHRRVLLVVPRASDAGRALALNRGGSLDHSEHAMALVGTPDEGTPDPHLTLRPAEQADVPELSRLMEAAFGRPAFDLADEISSGRSRTLVVERDGAPVGTLRVSDEDEGAGIYGFVVDPALQGRGIGRDVLRRVCRQLRADGVERVGLEVAVDNPHALGLYTSTGFTEVTTEDYYALPVPEGP
ncbi:MAG TPA: GNAT family N-acetyltransferase [Actinomycetales bacterium]